MKEVVSVVLSALLSSLGFYFSKPILFLPSLFLIIMAYVIGKMPKIRSQEDVKKFLVKYVKISSEEEVCNKKIIYTQDASLFVFFPSRVKSDVALVDGKYCIIKKGNEVLVYDAYQGIDEAVRILC